MKPMIRNVHRRPLAIGLEDAAPLLDRLASGQELLWPPGWPPMRFDGELRVGARGGHGPIRYTVLSVAPGRRVWFRFTGPPGFRGGHGLELASDGPGRSVLTHRLEMDLSGKAFLTWPLLFRPLHDALVEEAMDRAEAWSRGVPAPPPRRSLWVRLLRRLFMTVSRLRRVRAA